MHRYLLPLLLGVVLLAMVASWVWEAYILPHLVKTVTTTITVTVTEKIETSMLLIPHPRIYEVKWGDSYCRLLRALVDVAKLNISIAGNQCGFILDGPTEVWLVFHDEKNRMVLMGVRVVVGDKVYMNEFGNVSRLAYGDVKIDTILEVYIPVEMCDKLRRMLSPEDLGVFCNLPELQLGENEK